MPDPPSDRPEDDTETDETEADDPVDATDEHERGTDEFDLETDERGIDERDGIGDRAVDENGIDESGPAEEESDDLGEVARRDDGGGVDGPDEPISVSRDEFGTAPQYFDPAAETSDELPSAAEFSREEMTERGTTGAGEVLSALKATDDAAARRGLERARKMATLLDDAFEIPVVNYRVGLDPVLGIIPGGGDLAAALCSLYIVVEAARAGVPRNALVKMLALVAVDLVIGTVPLVGDAFDAVWKANKWNVDTFEEHVDGGAH